MSRRSRTAKALAQRIDLNYFRRMTPLRRWRLGLSVGLPAVALLWLAVMSAAGREEIYTAGPLSAAHAFIGENCESCHVREGGAFLKKVRDEACLSCHDGPAHQETQTFTPSCASCHRDHQGPLRLAQVPDTGCASCHSALETTGPGLRVARQVTSFANVHPEFAPLGAGVQDVTALKFNHASHLKPRLLAPMGEVSLECSDCHRPQGEDRDWRYAREGSGRPAAEARDPRQRLRGARMQPIEYEKHCASCHLLDFDPRIRAQAPHEEPDVVREFLRQSLRDYIAANPGELPVARREIRVPNHAFLPPGPSSAETWVAAGLRDAERLLAQKTCKQCHILEVANGRLVRVESPRIPERWLAHAEFTHQPHQMLDCNSCHSGVRESRATADVLLPGIDSCRACHTPERGAESGCFTCHGYHDWTKQKPAPGRYTIPQLRRGG